MLPRQLRGILNDLRGFRHVFRHSYDFGIDPRRLRLVIDDFLAGQSAMTDALSSFRQWLMEGDAG